MVRLTAVLGLLTLLTAIRPAASVGLRLGGEDTHLTAAALMQGWAVFSDGQAPDGSSLETELYLRRMRLLFFGQLGSRVNFFVQTDNPNLGKEGDLTPRMFIQDAWMEFNLHPAIQIDVGMLLTPFSHQGMQGAVSLHTLDYHSLMVRYPKGSNLVWRDFGLMLRGQLLDQLLAYRVAILNGVHGDPPVDRRNPRDWPRITGRLTLNIFESEDGPGVGGFFYDGIYLRESDEGILSPRKVLSLGFSADWQKDLNVRVSDPGGELRPEDYLALAVDLFLDMPLTGDRRLALCGQADFYYYDYGGADVLYHNGNDAAFGASYTGYGLLAEAGLRYDAYEILTGLNWFEATEAEGERGDLLWVFGGFNWWWKGHAASIKLQFGGARLDGGDWDLAGHLQAQLLF